MQRGPCHEWDLEDAEAAHLELTGERHRLDQDLAARATQLDEIVTTLET